MCCVALRVVQINKTTAQGETVCVSLCFSRQHSDRQSQVGNHARDHDQLLVILLAEHEHLWVDKQQKFQHYRQHTTKMLRTCFATELVCKRVVDDGSLKIRRINFL